MTEETKNGADPSEEKEENSETLVGKFFGQIREINLGERSELDFTAEELYEIADNISLRTEFRQAFSNFSQDPDTKSLILDLLNALNVDTTIEIERQSTHINTIDIYGQRSSGTVALGGAGALLLGSAAAGTIGPLVMTICGGVGLAACVFGRLKLSRRKRELEAKVTKLSSLLSDLEKNKDSDL